MTVTAPAVSKWRVGGLGAALQDQPRGQRSDDERHRHVHPQHPLPARTVGEDAAEQHARGATGTGDRSPGPECLVALGTVAEGVRDDRQRSRRDERGAETLGGAGSDQLALVGGETGHQRSSGDHQQSGDEHAPAPEQVGQAAAEQQEATERQHVGVDDPWEVGLGEVQRLTDRWQRDVHDRGVENDDELRKAEQDQGNPAALHVFLWVGHVWVSLRLPKKKRNVGSASTLYGI